MAGKTEWIAVDWGTSNLRAWGIGTGGSITFATSTDKGMGRLTPAAFPAALVEALTGHIERDGDALDVLICGMAGARQGWREAPYLQTPANLARLAGASVRPEIQDSRLSPRILPGICQREPGAEDVMRGEETQLLGLSVLIKDFTGIVVMPGTHSKWVELDGRIVRRFATAMTGELFEVLGTHSVLRHSVSGAPDDGDRNEGFESGLNTGLARPGMLVSELFRIRPRALLSGADAAWCSGFLSGLLIGAEIGGLRHWVSDKEVPLIGGKRLCGLYARGFSKLGITTRVIDATDATLAGLKAAREL